MRMWKRNDLIKLVRQKMAERGLNPHSLAKAAGVKPNTTSDWLCEPPRLQMPGPEKLFAILRVLGLEHTLLRKVKETAGGYEPLYSPPQGSAHIPIVGYVLADGDIHYYKPGELQAGADAIKAPDDAAVYDAALWIKTTNLEPAMREGDMVILQESLANPESCLGQDCAVGLNDGRRLLKKISKGSAPGLFDLHPLSTHGTIFTDCALAWAQRIAWVKRAPQQPII